MKTNILRAKSHANFQPGGCCGPAPRYRKLYVKLHGKQVLKQLDRLGDV